MRSFKNLLVMSFTFEPERAGVVLFAFFIGGKSKCNNILVKLVLRNDD